MIKYSFEDFQLAKKAKNITNLQIAEKTGVSQQFISALLHGRKKSRKILYKIIDILNPELDFFHEYNKYNKGEKR